MNLNWEKNSMMNKFESNYFVWSDIDKKKKMDELNIVSVFLIKMNDFWVYCNSGYVYYDCIIVKLVEERR